MKPVRYSPIRNRRAASGGSSLILTLLIVTVLSIIVAAFLQSMSIERLTAKSYANIARAEMAADAAASVAISQLSAAFEKSKGSDLIYQKNDYTYLLFPETKSGNASYTHIPLHSTEQPTPLSPANPGIGLLGLVNSPLSGAISGNLSGNASAQITPSQRDKNKKVAIGMIPLATAEDPSKQTARFGFWIEDYQGRVNLAFAGKSGSHDRPGINDPSEIALFSLFKRDELSQTASNPALSFINARNLKPALARFSPLAPLQFFTSAADRDMLLDLGCNLAIPYQLPCVIPKAFGYADEGKPKRDINKLVQDKDVQGIAKIINDNLPNFASSRRGGFSGAGKDYLKTIAASIIDYADTDDAPTVGTDHRGIDGAPFVNVLYTKYEWLQKNVPIFTPPQPPNYKIVVKVTTFVQVWNMSNRTVSGNLIFQDDNKDDIVQAGYAFGVSQNTWNLTLAPNEIRLLSFEKMHDVPTGPALISSNKLNLISTITSSARFDYRFSLSWNGGPAYDGNPAGGPANVAERPAKVLDLAGSGPPDWTGHLPGLRYYDNYSTNPSTQQLGDPRLTLYSSVHRIAANNYKDRNSWWGHAAMRSNRYFTRTDTWPDPSAQSLNGTLSVPYPEPSSTLSLNEYHHITDLNGYKALSKPLDSRNAPTRLSNSGRYENICELGNIYDPAQWSYNRFDSFVDGHPVRGIPATASSDANFGGGITLRIGRPEHEKFDQRGRRAAQLLDLFEAGNGTASVVKTFRGEGRINVNTAPEEVLQCLVAGIKIESDTAVGARQLPSPSSGGFVGEHFVKALLKMREDGPIFSTAELAGLRDVTDPEPDMIKKRRIFGDNRIWDTSERPPSTLADSASEEVFRKIWPHLATTSRAFRLVVVGQSLGPTGRVTSTVRREHTLIFTYDEASETFRPVLLNEIVN